MKQKEFVLLKHHHPILDMIKVDDREFCSSAFKVFFWQLISYTKNFSTQGFLKKSKESKTS